MTDLVATSIRSDLGYVEEVKYGIVPDNPIFTVFRRTSAAELILTKDAFVSEESLLGRQIADLRHGIRRVVGDIKSEIISPDYTDHLAALMGNHWVGLGIGASGSITVTNLTNDGYIADFTGWDSLEGSNLSAGMRVRLHGFDDAENNGWITLIAVIAPLTLVLCKDKSDFSEPFRTVVADSGGSLDTPGSFIRIGNAYRSFTFERSFPDIQRYQSYSGLMVNALTVNIPAARLATFIWNYVGKDASGLVNSSKDSSAVAPVIVTEGDWGVLSFDEDHTLTATTSSFLTELSKGISIVFDSLTISGPGDLSDMPGKLYVVHEVVSDTEVVFVELVGAGNTSAFTANYFKDPEYTQPAGGDPLIGISGAVYIGQENNVRQSAVVLDINFTVDNKISGTPIVGQNVLPFSVFGKNQSIIGTVTVLFEDENIYNLFEKEQEAMLVVRLDSAMDPDSFMQFTFPRCKFYSGDVGDAVSEGLPVGMGFRALRPDPLMTTFGDFLLTTSLLIQSFPAPQEAIYLLEDGSALLMEGGMEAFLLE